MLLRLICCLLSFTLFLKPLSWGADTKFEILEGCQGEGCGCTHDEKSFSGFILYEAMDEKSKIIGKFPKDTSAKALKSLTKVIVPGKAKILKVKNPKINLKVGAEVTHIFYLGEGITKVKRDGRWIEFDDEEVKLEYFEQPKLEEWTEISTGKARGFARGFPFFGCLG